MQSYKKELEKLKYYIQEKERLTKEIEDYNEKYATDYKSQDFTNPKIDTGRDINKIERMIYKNERITKEIKKRLKKVEILIIRLYKIINAIEDPQLKSIVELRAIKGMTWEQIGEAMYIDRSVAFRKYKVFIEK